MQPQRPSARVYWKYSLFQIPGVLLILLALLVFDHWLPVPAWVYLSVLGVWLLKDALIFPFIWRAYDDRQKAHSYSPEGQEALVVDAIDPVGRVRLRGELWRAEIAGDGADLGEALAEGQQVRVVEARGLVLIVEALAPQEPEGQGED